MPSSCDPNGYQVLSPQVQDAVHQEAFEPFFQPTHDVAGRVQAIEVLTRWPGVHRDVCPRFFYPRPPQAFGYRP